MYLAEGHALLLIMCMSMYYVYVVWYPWQQVAREDMRGCVQELCPIVMAMLQDSSSLAKREVALWTFGQLVENTG